MKEKLQFYLRRWKGSPRLRSMWPMLAMAGLIVALLVMFVQVVFRLPPVSIQTSGELQKLSLPSGRVSIPYPSRWIVTDGGDGLSDGSGILATVDAPKIPPPGAHVVIRRSLETFDSLDQAVQWGTQLSQSQQGYHEVSTERAVLNGEDTVIVEYEMQMAPSPLVPNPKLRCLDNYRLHQSHGYLLTFCSGAGDFPTVERTFRQMIDSFAYLK